MKKRINGCIYQRNGRYYLKAKLPGEEKVKARPLKPIGAKFATTDRAVAEEVAKLMWDNATFKTEPTTGSVRTVAGLIRAYMAYTKKYYGSNSREPENIKYALTPLADNYGKLPAEEFNSLHLKELQQKLIDLHWSRGVINKRVGMIKRMFKWAASERIIPVNVYQGLQTVEGLKRGRSGAKETSPVEPIAERHVKAILPYTSPVVAAMLQVQLLTGMRSSELCTMRPCDIETTGKIWYYRPQTHKTAYRGHKRIIAVGPQAQEIIRPFLSRKLDEYIFTPAESETHRLHTHTKKIGNHYDKDSYRKAVKYGIKAARAAGLDVPEFHPHRLRHSTATKIRKAVGLDAARAVLGHRSSKVTEDYAELDAGLASETMSKLG